MPQAGRRWWLRWCRGLLHPGSQISFASAGPLDSVPKNGEVPVSSENWLQLTVPGALRRYPVRPFVRVQAARFCDAEAVKAPAKASGASSLPESSIALASVLRATWNVYDPYGEMNANTSTRIRQSTSFTLTVTGANRSSAVACA